MQSMNWYVRRLAAMSAAELAWRCKGKVRDWVDRALMPRRSRPQEWERLVAGGSDRPLVDSRVGLGPWVGQDLASLRHDGAAWQAGLVTEAERLTDLRLRIFDLDVQYPGPDIDWNHEPKAAIDTPMIRSAAIDYRDVRITGDCKFVWEPNRHHHLVVLARAYRITGDERYANSALAQIESWIAQCPYGCGMNWRSPLELGIRLINWAWTLSLLEGATCLSAERMRGIAASAHRQIWEIQRQYSRYSSANNHLIGEAAGVFIGCAFFRGLKDARRWQRRSREILTREIAAQTHADGVTREQAVGYHLFVAQFFLLAGLTARHQGEDFPPDYWDRLEAMFDFLAALHEGGPLPMFGDCDDGYVLDLGDRSVEGWLSAAALALDRPDWAAASGAFSETAWWLFGVPGRHRYRRLHRMGAEDAALSSRAFPEAGYYLLQRGHRGRPDSVSVGFDCGELGFTSIAAHGHADALSLTLRVAGRDVLVDPGTYDYFTYPQWRSYFRSTRAHNTVTVDGCNQSEMLGPFLWGRRASARLLNWNPSDQGGTIRAEHDGYRRLPGPVIHRRTVTIGAGVEILMVHDELMAEGSHEVTFHWHFAEHCTVDLIEDNGLAVDFGAGRLRVFVPEELELTILRGCEEPQAGWVSRGYHRKVPAPTVVAKGLIRGNASFTTRVVLQGVKSGLDAERWVEAVGALADWEV